MTKNKRNFSDFALGHKKVFFVASRCSKCLNSDRQTPAGVAPKRSSNRCLWPLNGSRCRRKSCIKQSSQAGSPKDLAAFTSWDPRYNFNGRRHRTGWPYNTAPVLLRNLCNILAKHQVQSKYISLRIFIIDLFWSLSMYMIEWTDIHT